MTETAKTLEDNSNYKNPIFINLISFIFILGTAYIVLLGEHINGTFPYFYFENIFKHYFFPETPRQICAFPIKFWALWFLLSSFFYITKTINNQKVFLQSSILSGLICHLFLIFLTLQKDSQFNSFYWPIEGTISFKGPYISIVCLVVLFSIYLFSFNSFIKKNHRLDVFSIPIRYLPTVPFIFQYNSLTNLKLIAASIATIYFWDRSNIKIKAFIKNINEKTFCYFLLSSIFIFGFIFRYINLIILWDFGGEPEFCGHAEDGPEYCVKIYKIMNDNDFTGHAENSVLSSGYPYLIGLLIKITDSIFGAMVIQAIIGSLIPIIIFFIVKKIINQKTAFYTALFCSLSYNLIYQSVVIGRAGLAVFVWIFIVYLIIGIPSRNNNNLSLLGIGLFAGLCGLLSPELLPLTFLILLIQYKHLLRGLFKNTLILIFGFTLAQSHFQFLVYENYNEIWVFGRPNKLHTISEHFSDNPVGSLLIEKKINFITEPIQSLFNLIKNPIEVFPLVTKRFLVEFSSYVFDHQPFYFDPVFLQQDTYFSGTLLFYILLILTIGTLCFLRAQNITKINKIIIGVVSAYHILFFTLIHSGWARFVSQNQPLYLALLAFGFVTISGWFFPTKNRISNNERALLASKNIKSTAIQNNENRNPIIFRLGLGITLLLILILLKNPTFNPSVPIEKSQISFVRHNGKKIINYKKYFKLGMDYYEKRKYSDAIKALKVSSKSENYFGNLYYAQSNFLLGELYFKLNNLDKSKFYYEKVFTTNSLDSKHYSFERFFASAANGLSAIYGKDRDFDKSIEFAQKSIEINPDFAPSYFNLANALHMKNQLKEALKNYQLAIKIQPDYKRAIFNLAYLESQLGLLEKSESHYLDFIDLDPNNEKTYYGLATVYALKKQHQKAISHYQKSLAVNPNYAPAQIDLAKTLLFSGQTDKAIVNFEKALLLNPNAADIHKYLAEIYLKLKNNSKKGNFHLQRSIDLENENR